MALAVTLIHNIKLINVVSDIFYVSRVSSQLSHDAPCVYVYMCSVAHLYIIYPVFFFHTYAKNKNMPQLYDARLVYATPTVDI